MATIPENIIALLNRYKGNAFGMSDVGQPTLNILKELFEDHPALFWFAYTYAKDHHWQEQPVRIMCAKAKELKSLKHVDCPILLRQ